MSHYTELESANICMHLYHNSCIHLFINLSLLTALEPKYIVENNERVAKRRDLIIMIRCMVEKKRGRKKGRRTSVKIKMAGNKKRTTEESR